MTGANNYIFVSGKNHMFEPYGYFHTNTHTLHKNIDSCGV